MLVLTDALLNQALLIKIY